MKDPTKEANRKKTLHAIKTIRKRAVLQRPKGARSCCARLLRRCEFIMNRINSPHHPNQPSKQRTSLAGAVLRWCWCAAVSDRKYTRKHTLHVSIMRDDVYDDDDDDDPARLAPAGWCGGG